mgnify:CR=1 FL=1
MYQMSAVDIETFKNRAEEFVAKAIAGEPTIIEQQGKRAVILSCGDEIPDFETYPDTDALLRKRLQSEGREPTPSDWQKLRDRITEG